MENKIKNYIAKKIKAKKLQEFLKKLIDSKEINDKLLCLCILIDLKYKLLKEKDYLPIFSGSSPESALDYEISMPPSLCIACVGKEKYARVVSESKFKTKYSTAKYERKNPRFDHKKITDEGGWFGEKAEKDFVWITLYDDIKLVIDNSRHEPYKANKACDFVGFVKDYRTRSPRTQDFVLIIYSEKFPDCVHQPNSSNADWKYQDTLFICYNNSDGFGRTYNRHLS